MELTGAGDTAMVLSLVGTDDGMVELGGSPWDEVLVVWCTHAQCCAVLRKPGRAKVAPHPGLTIGPALGALTAPIGDALDEHGRLFAQYDLLGITSALWPAAGAPGNGTEVAAARSAICCGYTRQANSRAPLACARSRLLALMRFNLLGAEVG